MPEQRKVVTILFADVVGSTGMASVRDPEVVRALMSRFFVRVADIAGAYGGTVEKFAGDAAMVVFGVPAVHDDDAERAVRAALEIREAARELAVRVGVNTGEAVTAATADRQFMVSGDAVNVAARLQQGADAGEVVVGSLTHQLSRGAIDYEARAAIVAKGKTDPITAYRALRPRSAVPVQVRGVAGLHAALVGRNRELRLLQDTVARVAEGRSPHLFTVIGAAGVGKSRLVDEALSTSAGAGTRALRGRCLPYGRGITYWPLVEMVQQDTRISIADDREVALRKLDRWLGELMAGDGQRPAVRARLAVALGLEDADTVMADTPADRVDRELAWAARQYMRAIAGDSPVVAVFDDLQWAERPLVNLLEELVERVSDAPLLVVAMARPEFIESHGDWGAGKRNATTITLDPLSATETSTLVSRLLEVEALPEDLRRQIVERSAGTPLFCEEFIHMLIDEGVVAPEGMRWKATRPVSEIRVPESISAVLAARLDLLPESERTALQAASVVGQRFEIGQVQALVADRDVASVLESLRRKELIAGGDGPDDEYSFRHILVRDAAYGSLTKSGRALLHDRFRDVLEGRTPEPEQIAEILAHHAERAFALSYELDLGQEIIEVRARSALRWLSVVADRARMRHDLSTLDPALASMRTCAAALAGGGGAAERARIALLEAQALVIKGQYADARGAAGNAAALAEQAGLPDVVAKARLTEAWITNWSLDEPLDAFSRIVKRAVDACQQAGDVPSEIEARHIGTNVLWSLGRIDEFVTVNEELVRLAEAAGDVTHVAAITARLVPAEFIRGNFEQGTRHLEVAESMAARYGFRNVALRTQFDRAMDQMWRGNLADAERRLREYRANAMEAGARQHEMSAVRFLGYTLVAADRPTEAAEVLDEALALSETTGERWNRAEVLALRAGAALAAGELEAAERFVQRAVAAARPDDLTAVSESQTQLGVIRAAQHREAEAEAAFRRAVEAVAGTPYVNIGIPAAVSFAIFLAERGRHDEAAAVAAPFLDAIEIRGLHLWDRIVKRYRRLDKTKRLV